MSAGKGSKPRPQTPEGRRRFDKNMVAIYGVRVKIPPPGPEREDMASRVAAEVLRQGGFVSQEVVRMVIRALAEGEA